MKQFAVIGLGRFGTSVANELARKKQQVLAIDANEDLVHNIMDDVTKAVCLDATDEKAARSIGLDKVDVAICGIGTNIESSILITLLLKELGVPVVVCKATSAEHKKVLEKIGATRVIQPEKDTGERVAATLISMSDTVLEHIGLTENSSIVEIVAPATFVGKTLRELEMRSKYGVNVIAIKKKITMQNGDEVVETEEINVAPQADDVVTKGEIIVVFGENDKIDELKVSVKNSRV